MLKGLCGGYFGCDIYINCVNVIKLLMWIFLDFY